MIDRFWDWFDDHLYARHNKWLGSGLCLGCKSSFRSYMDHPDLFDYDFDSNWHKIRRLVYKESEMATTQAISGDPQLGDWVWHVHHETLVEKLTDSFANRVAFIKGNKGDVDTRLHFMRPVKNPPKGNANSAKVEAAQRVFNTLCNAYNNGNVEYGSYARARNHLEDAQNEVSTPTQADWEALHKQECFDYCPWNGLTLFPKGEKTRS